MKIVHIAPNAPYDEAWGFHENLLPKYQKKLGHDVTVLVTNLIHEDGRIVETECLDAFVDSGVNVIRMKKKKYWHPLLTSLCSKLEVYGYLKDIRPDFIFYHGLSSTTIFEAVKYKKRDNPACIIVQDNHIDENNAYRTGGIQDFLVRTFYRWIVRKTVPYVSKVYGVTPWRKTYAEKYYGVPKNKTDVLIMGADDEKIDFSNRGQIRSSSREKYGILDDEFLIVTGGKINSAKKIHILMEACKGMTGVKLLVFGNVIDEFKEEFEQHVMDNKNVIHIGWIPSGEVYSYFFAADLVFFPGGHSVMWEQACASKVPCVFQKWNEMEHVNHGGNSDFVFPVTVENIRKKITELQYTAKYYDIKKVAESGATDIYLYSNIAAKSLECVTIK